MSPSEVRAHFEKQAQACAHLGSPFTAMLCLTLGRILDPSDRVGSAILQWKGDAGADALALRLCGGLHRLVLQAQDAKLAAAYPPNAANRDVLEVVLPQVLHRHSQQLLAELQRAPQTNEIARSGMLLPGFLFLARQTDLPLKLYEIGSSAGLNLLFDRFGYQFAGRRWGQSASPVQITPEIRGKKAIPLGGNLMIASRRGCDLAPIDVQEAQARMRLRSFVWADQDQRLARLDGALKLAQQTPVDLDQIDAEAFVRNELAETPQGAVRVVFHSIMWQYMPVEARDAIEAQLAAVGSAASKSSPLAWLRMEPTGAGAPWAELTLTLWPNARTLHLANCDYHGRWIEWLV
ncbi:DUF2332 domain-containing protein [Tianweitania sediminis]|uniref:DUF2332 family protein n=1 Tax=Tianweitania sediminis TaxID=1502156 RepID=A0A8J7UIH0_9HYPH|nr:DUF2332 family protein [Tianweitania sediminis]MBP0437805.1 DUF2332 family protein [Tianweitania sediminis]